MMTGLIIAFLAMTIACVVICHTIAKRRGLKPVFWGVMGALFGPFAIPFVFLGKPETD